jgi:hypothetical protein
LLEEYRASVADNLLARGVDLAVEAPVEYLCPISGTLMSDPVMAADGFSYERAHIEGWIRAMKRNGMLFRSPSTDEPLEHINLNPNQNLRVLIGNYRRTMGIPGPPSSHHTHHMQPMPPNYYDKRPTYNQGGAAGRRPTSTTPTTSPNPNLLPQPPNKQGLPTGPTDQQKAMNMFQQLDISGRQPAGAGAGGVSRPGSTASETSVISPASMSTAGGGTTSGTEGFLDGSSAGAYGAAMAAGRAAGAGMAGYGGGVSPAYTSPMYPSDMSNATTVESPSPTVITEGGLLGSVSTNVNTNSPLIQSLTQLIGPGGLANLVPLNMLEEKDMVRKKVNGCTHCTLFSPDSSSRAWAREGGAVLSPSSSAPICRCLSAGVVPGAPREALDRFQRLGGQQDHDAHRHRHRGRSGGHPGLHARQQERRGRADRFDQRVQGRHHHRPGMSTYTLIHIYRMFCRCDQRRLHILHISRSWCVVYCVPCVVFNCALQKLVFAVIDVGARILEDL